MNRKYFVLGLIALLIIAGGITLAVVRTSSSTTQLQDNHKAKQLTFKFSDLQANYPANPDACLAAESDADLKLDNLDRTDIENANLGTIIDIPAGTNVDVYVKTYDKTIATGTSEYESTFGSYNFTAQKAAASSTDNAHWVISKFAACKK